ncbi:MAG: hypothetical protein GC152_10145 [Alphaproteobacteria bacterium]|nr:hypothetical protein [Alphaproteobacteria bacterium]
MTRLKSSDAKAFAAAIAFAGTGLATAARAEVIETGPDHFRLGLEATSPLPPDRLRRRLIDPSDWWSGDHTYSGDASNLALDLQPGGLWSETWAGGAVAHGRVLMFRTGEMLRLEAPFGPLQGLGVAAVWTISISPDGDGSKVRFDYVANGGDDLEPLAAAVDSVKSAALKNLTRPD